MSFILFYNHQKKLKSLKFKSPYDILLEKFDVMLSLFQGDSSCELVGRIPSEICTLMLDFDIANPIEYILEPLQSSNKFTTSY